ncbi:MAG: hypothetical protein MJK14_25675 [Rivularia sp. ALOHA_DT_140]|nr:hypothetical protein [Rivularia sp. ALOHA_DT_140]
MISTFPEAPNGLSGNPKRFLMASSKIFAEEIIKLGLREPSAIPLTSTDSEAFTVTLPAAPLILVEESIRPPSRTIKRPVLTIKLPAFPLPIVGELIALG